MAKYVTWSLVALPLILIIWMIGSLGIVAGIEEAKYEVISQQRGYEVRRYAPYLVAETAMPTLGTSDRSNAFRGIAAYIFGGNESRQSIAMTAPVVMDAPVSPTTVASEKIAMTAPVIMTAGVMQFVMPAKYKTLDDLPKPKDPRIKLRQQASTVTAALTFSWYATDAKVAEKTAELRALLLRDQKHGVSSPRLASYDPPFSTPFLKRHEILIDIE